MSASDLLRSVASLSAIVHASDRPDGSVRIDLISVPREIRGRGCARQALAEIAAWADASGTELSLTATSALGSNVPRLLGLYADYGFVPTGLNRGGDAKMRRSPQAVERDVAA
jgi:GNAT superfamily N-acetyltransferase